jgi:hypothetical protein
VQPDRTREELVNLAQGAEKVFEAQQSAEKPGSSRYRRLQQAQRLANLLRKYAAATEMPGAYINAFCSNLAPFQDPVQSRISDKDLDSFVAQTLSALRYGIDHKELKPRNLAAEQELLEAVRTHEYGVREDAVTAAAEIQATAKNVAEAAGLVGIGALAESFVEYAADQGAQANRWLAGTLAAVLAVVAVGVWLLVSANSTAGYQLGQTVSHVVIALPVLGAAAYSARESSRHREAAQWGRQLVAQLRAIGAYADALDDDRQGELWAHFGRYVFGPHAPGRADNQLHSIPPELVEAVLNAAKK